MRLSLTVEAREGFCSKCERGPLPVIPFLFITELHSGDATPLCQSCLFNPDGLVAEVEMTELAPGRRRPNFKKNKQRSLRQEVDIMEELGGRTQPGSGNQPGAKGDGRKKGELRVEAKFTEANSYSLKLDDLYKIAGEASFGEMPLFIIDYLEPGKRSLKDRFVVLHFNDLKGLLDAARNNR